jgi:hypothetical protein
MKIILPIALAAALFSSNVNAQTAYCNYNMSQCHYVSVTQQEKQPSSQLLPEENLQLLYEKSAQKEKELSEQWFSSGKELDRERKNMIIYKSLLKNIRNDN